jgi:hypothetical protein
MTTTVYVRYSRETRPEDVMRWLCDNIGPDGVRYYLELNRLVNVNLEAGLVAPMLQMAVTFDHMEDAELFKLRWL